MAAGLGAALPDREALWGSDLPRGLPDWEIHDKATRPLCVVTLLKRP